MASTISDDATEQLAQLRDQQAQINQKIAGLEAALDPAIATAEVKVEGTGAAVAAKEAWEGRWSS